MLPYVSPLPVNIQLSKKINYKNITLGRINFIRNLYQETTLSHTLKCSVLNRECHHKVQKILSKKSHAIEDLLSPFFLISPSLPVVISMGGGHCFQYPVYPSMISSDKQVGIQIYISPQYERQREISRFYFSFFLDDVCLGELVVSSKCKSYRPKIHLPHLFLLHFSISSLPKCPLDVAPYISTAHSTRYLRLPQHPNQYVAAKVLFFNLKFDFVSCLNPSITFHCFEN